MTTNPEYYKLNQADISKNQNTFHSKVKKFQVFLDIFGFDKKVDDMPFELLNKELFARYTI